MATIFSTELLKLIIVFAAAASIAECGYMTFGNKQLEQCLNLFSNVTTLEDFSENFAQQFIELQEKIPTTDLALCLHTNTDKPIDDVRELKNILEIGKESDVCSYTFVYNYLSRYHDERFSNNPGHNLKNIFQSYVRKVISLCKAVLTEKMLQVKQDADFPYLLDTITNLLSNTTKSESNSFNGRKKQQQQQQVTTIVGAKLEALVFSEEIMANLKRVPVVTIDHSSDVLKNLDRVRWSCHHLFVYQRDILYTIAELSKKGYTESLPSLDQLSQDAANLLLSWLNTAQICEIIKLVGVREASTRGSHLRLIFYNSQENLGEIEFKSFDFSPSVSRKIVDLKGESLLTDKPCSSVLLFSLVKRLLYRTVVAQTTTNCTQQENGLVRAKVIDAIIDRFINEQFLESLGRYLSDPH